MDPQSNDNAPPQSAVVATPRNTGVPNTIAALLVLIGVATLVLALQASGEDIAYSTGYALGQFIFFGLLAYALARLTLGAKSRWMPVVVAAAFFLSTAGYASSLLAAAQDAKAFVSEVQSLLAKALSNQDLRTSSLKDVGRYNEALAVVARQYTEWQKAFRTFNADVERAGVPNMLAPQNLDTRAKRQRSRLALAALLPKLDDTEKRILGGFDAADRELQALDMPPRFKESFLKGFRSSRGATQLQMENFFDIEREFLDECRALLDFLDTQEGRFAVQGDKLMFATAAAVERYNTHIGRLQEVAKREAEVIAARTESANKKLQELDEALK